MTEQDLAGLYRDSLVDNGAAVTYLRDFRRIPEHIANDGLGRVGFLPKVEYRGKYVYDVMIIPVFDVLGRLSMLECRAIYNKQYFKLRHGKTRIPLYMDFIKVWKNREKKSLILVEGAIEAMSIQAHSDKLLVASTLRASASKAQLHLLKYYSNNIVLLYNTDAAGINNAKKIMDFYREKYGINVTIEELPDDSHKDLNEMLTNSPKDFKEFIEYLEDEYA